MWSAWFKESTTILTNGVFRKTPASDYTIRQWMEEQNFRLRKIIKVKAGGESPNRDAQFENITQLIFTSVMIDTKIKSAGIVVIFRDYVIEKRATSFRLLDPGYSGQAITF